jgi:hypothetical protein
MVMQTLSVAFGLMAITNELVELGTQNLVDG